MGTSLKHSGHFFVVGSAGGSPRARRAARAFTGTTTKKYTAAEIRTNESNALMKSPIRNWLPLTVKCNRRKIRLADDRGDQRSEQVLDHRCNHGAERAADDDGDGQVDDVAAQQELTEAFEHVIPLRSVLAGLTLPAVRRFRLRRGFGEVTPKFVGSIGERRREGPQGGRRSVDRDARRTSESLISLSDFRLQVLWGCPKGTCVGRALPASDSFADAWRVRGSAEGPTAPSVERAFRDQVWRSTLLDEGAIPQLGDRLPAAAPECS